MGRDLEDEEEEEGLEEEEEEDCCWLPPLPSSVGAAMTNLHLWAKVKNDRRHVCPPESTPSYKIILASGAHFLTASLTCIVLDVGSSG